MSVAKDKAGDNDKNRGAAMVAYIHHFVPVGSWNPLRASCCESPSLLNQQFPYSSTLRRHMKEICTLSKTSTSSRYNLPETCYAHLGKCMVGVPKKVVSTIKSAHVHVSIHCLIKIKFDFTKCNFNFLHLLRIKEIFFIIIEEV
jgi:hypothetical protein